MGYYNSPEGTRERYERQLQYFEERDKAEKLQQQRNAKLNYARTLKNNANLQSKIHEIEALQEKLQKTRNNLQKTKNLQLNAYGLNKNKTIKNAIRAKAGSNFIKKSLKNRITNYTNLGASTSWRRSLRYQNSLKPQIQRLEQEVTNTKKRLNILLNSLPQKP